MIDVKETYKEGYKDNMKKKLYGLLREREKDGEWEKVFTEKPPVFTKEEYIAFQDSMQTSFDMPMDPLPIVGKK